MIRRIVEKSSTARKFKLLCWFLADEIVTAVSSYKDSARELRGTSAARRISSAPASPTVRRPCTSDSMPISAGHWSASRPRSWRRCVMPSGNSAHAGT